MNEQREQKERTTHSFHFFVFFSFGLFSRSFLCVHINGDFEFFGAVPADQNTFMKARNGPPL